MTEKQQLMNTIDPTPPTIHLEHATPSNVSRTRIRPMAIGAVALLVVAVSAAAIWTTADGIERSEPEHRPDVTQQETLEDLVHRGLIPRQALESARPSHDEIVRELVHRGLIPRQALESVRPSQDEILRGLVQRGLIPRQALEPAPPAEISLG